VKVVALVPDLLDRSRIEGAAAGTGAELRFISSMDDDAASDADLVVIDLSRAGALDVLDSSRARVIGFAPHVDTATLAGARQDGRVEALPRSVFFARLPALFREDSSS
jgi:hypothetical protein